MNVVFRVDASRQIGTGHVMRCLALAEGLRERSANVSFICAGLEGNLIEYLREAGYTVHSLPRSAPVSGAGSSGKASPYEDWLGAPWQTDAEQTRAVLANEKRRVDYMVVDHYALGSGWEETVAPLVHGILAIDDLADRKHACDILLDQNLTLELAARYNELVPESAQCLCGPRYALLQPEYAQARRVTGPRRGHLSRVLVFYGGTDNHNETARALRVLSEPSNRDIYVDLVIGANNANRKVLAESAAKRQRTNVYSPQKHLADLMTVSDLALGAGGITTWERCVLGLPSIVTAVAANQEPFQEALATMGAIRYLGRSEDINDSDLLEAILELKNKPERLAELSQKAWRITDGRGTERLVELLWPTSQPELTLRKASTEDKTLYFEWANDPATREYAHNPQPIPWAIHDNWFDRHLKHPDSWLLVLETSTELPVGQVRIDLKDGEAILDYSIDIAFRGRGWGTRTLELTKNFWQKIRSDIPLVGEVHMGNEASRRAFLAAGFMEVESNGCQTWRFQF